MTLVQSWIDSLTLLKPKNAQLFIMVTIKSIIEAYKLMLYYWGWVIVIMIGCFIASKMLPVIELPLYGDSRILLSIISQWLYQLLLFATCLATRPSIMKKNCAYFRSQMYAFVYLIILLLVTPKLFWPTAISPLYIFWVLFFLDSTKEPKDFLLSLWYSIKMIIYNFPLLVVVGIMFNIPVLIYHSLPLWPSPIARDIFAALLLPIGVCMFANIYIKKLHDQFDLYFQRS